MSPNDVLRPGWLREEVNKASDRASKLVNRHDNAGSQQQPEATQEAKLQEDAPQPLRE
jgi:hypothetical protein